MPKVLMAEVTMPYSRAVCTDPTHPKQRCAIGRTAFGPGKFSYLHKMRDEPVDQVDCPGLVKPLYDLGRAFLTLVDKEDWALDGQLFVDGPYPDFIDDHSAYRGEGKGASREKQQEAILAASGIVTDQVRYRLYGRFCNRKEQVSCLGSGEPVISEVSEGFLVSTP